jgi:DNA-binding NtrC family response regulator
MSSASLAGCSILVCEDEPLIALSIANAFTEVGARIVTARSFASALIAVENEVPAAVILDHVLSDGESSQFRKRLKQRNIPYVVHSGYSNLDGARNDEEYDVPKPANPDVLVTTVLRILRRRELSRRPSSVVLPGRRRTLHLNL